MMWLANMNIHRYIQVVSRKNNTTKSLNMASGYIHPLITSSEEDIPGASFVYAQLEKHSIDQL